MIRYVVQEIHVRSETKYMKIAVMQPYFFPYLGYWQMFNAVDTFVLLDDVNYIKRGYINSNVILVNGAAHKFTIPLSKPSQNRLIKDTKLKFSKDDKDSFLRMVTLAYKKAPLFNKFFPVFEAIVNQETDDLTSYLFESFIEIKKYLGIKTEVILSSAIDKDNSLRAEARILEINKKLGAEVYINAIGGQNLYSYDHFSKENIKLCFIKTLQNDYKQFNDEFVPNLSFIDVLMFNDTEKVHEMLNRYELITNNS